jgi:hypothetical protein
VKKIYLWKWPQNLAYTQIQLEPIDIAATCAAPMNRHAQKAKFLSVLSSMNVA